MYSEIASFGGACEQPSGTAVWISHGVLWRRAGELLSVITLDAEQESWCKAGEGFEELKETRFAMAEEIAACPPIKEALRTGDRVLHYRNAPLRDIPRMIPAAATSNNRVGSGRLQSMVRSCEPDAMKHLLPGIILAGCLLTGTLPAQEKSKPVTGSKPGSGLPAGVHQLKIGDAAPDFKLQGVDGKFHALADFKPAPVLMVIFLSNHCPYSHAMEPRLLKLLAETKARGLAVVAIQPNHPDAVRLDELGYSKYNDSYDEMKLYAKEQGFTFPYLYDGDTQATAKAYGCLATPHVFLFDRDRRLQYAGRFDDSRFADPATVTSPDTRNAVEAMLAGRPVPVAETRPMGCSTKWNEKKAEVGKVTEQWEKSPVSVERIDAAGIAALAKNGSEKFRLFNVWATWCGPCVKEFPGLVSLTRRLGSRDFELITLSVDDPKDEAKAQAFLERQHAAIPSRLKRSVEQEGRRTNNYLYTGASTDALFKALDPAAPGPVPHTVLIAPGGRILFRHTGELGADELLAKVLEQLGPYYK